MFGIFGVVHKIKVCDNLQNNFPFVRNFHEFLHEIRFRLHFAVGLPGVTGKLNFKNFKYDNYKFKNKMYGNRCN